MTEIIDKLKLNLIEEAVFEVILSKVDAKQGGAEECSTLSTQILTISPEIVALTDNKNGGINIKWKLKTQRVNLDGENRLQLEYAVNEQELDFGHGNSKSIDFHNIDLNSEYETRNVVIDNINANIFRLKWNNFGNIKELKIETDLWDQNHKGQHIQVHGNVIRHTATTTWSSIYGRVLCKAPYTYHWRFKIKAFAIYFMFGISRESDNYSVVNSYLGATNNAFGYYAANSNNNQAHVYHLGANGQFGMQRFNKNGCVLDMYLDLKNYKLSFKTGGQDTGVVIDDLPHIFTSFDILQSKLFKLNNQPI